MGTRHNQIQQYGVANGQTWTVERVDAGGGLRLPAGTDRARVPAAYVAEHVHLGYATTDRRVQGGTVDRAATVLSVQTGADSPYVAMTRGRYENAVHVTAADLAGAREQWIEAAGRDRADLGLGHARLAAAAAAVTSGWPMRGSSRRSPMYCSTMLNGAPPTDPAK